MLEKLYYSGENNRWVGLPAWASFYITLGSVTANSTKLGARLIVGLALPARAYAAALAAFGVAITRSAIPLDQVSSSEHFQLLCNLKRGAPVSYFDREKDVMLKGIFTGCEVNQGQMYVKIQVQDTSPANSGGLTRFVSMKNALDVEMLLKGPEKLPKRLTGKLVTPLGAFARYFLGDDQATVYTRHSRLECLLLGRINLLQREIIETRFAVKTDEQELSEGILQDVLRVRRFIDEDEHFRSEITRVDGRKVPVAVGDAIPHVAIFDGATSFWKWRDYLRNSNWIVFLDRTDPYFRNAAEVFNNEYMSRINDDCLEGIPFVPPGVEILSYYESK